MVVFGERIILPDRSLSLAPKKPTRKVPFPPAFPLLPLPPVFFFTMLSLKVRFKQRLDKGTLQAYSKGTLRNQA